MTCETVRLGDGTVAIVCHRGKRWRRCSVPGCGGIADHLCDYRSGGKTCDKPLCAMHAVPQGRNRDHCPDHPNQQLALLLPLASITG